MSVPRRRKVQEANRYGITAVTSRLDGDFSVIGMATASGLHEVRIPAALRGFIIDELKDHGA